MGLNWVDPLLDKAKAEAATVEDANTRKYLMQGVGILENNKGTLKYLGEQGFKSFIGLIGMGKRTEAKEALINAMQDPEALIADADNAAANIMDAPSVDWDEVAGRIVKSLGDMVARILGAFLLKM